MLYILISVISGFAGFKAFRDARREAELFKLFGSDLLSKRNIASLLRSYSKYISSSLFKCISINVFAHQQWPS